MLFNRRLNGLLLFPFFAVLCCESSAGDWPQILGPGRDGVGVNEKLADKWPESGPKVLWQRKVGDGFSGIAVSKGIAVLFHRVGAREVVEGMNARTGKVLWTAGHATSYATGFSTDQGPRCTPVIHNEHVYVFGAQGVLRCLTLKGGKSVWMRKTHADFQAPAGYFGAGSTPIVVGDNLLVNVGSRNKAGIVAFNLKTGKTAWKATSEYGSYSSPVAATIDKTKHVFFITRYNLVSIDPDTGNVRFSFPFGKRGPTVNGSSPVIHDGHLFVTAHYGVGARYAKIGKTGVKTVWADDEIMSSQYMTSVPHAKHLIGIHGQERVGLGELRCFDPRTKKIRWKKPAFGYGTMIKADGKLLFLSTKGELVLLKAGLEKYRELARANVLDTTTRALPALSNGRLYVRDTRTLKCLQVGTE